MMKKKIINGAASSLLFALAHNAHATNGDQMLGVTAIQWGMGGAVVAAPQDAGTIMTNPAGLAELGIKDVRFDMGAGVLNPPRKANGHDSDSDYYLMPSGAVAFNVNDKLFLGMGMGGISGSGVDFPDVLNAAPGAQAVVTTKQSYKIAPGFAYKVSDQLSVGATFQIGYQSLAMYNGMNPAGTLTLPQTQVYGAGMNAGLIYRLGNTVQVGASWTSKTKMDEFKWNTNSGNYRMTLDMPQIFALGIAFKPLSGLLVEADVKRIGFSNVLDRVEFQTPAGASSMNFGWSDQTVYAIGVQKEVNANTTVRAGFNYGKSPIGAEDVNTNIGSLAITEKHFTLGATRKFNEKVSASISYAHAFQNEIVSNVAPYNKIELEQNIVNVQLSYKY